MNLSSLSIKRPVATIMLLLIVVVVGFFSLVGLPMDLLPEMDLPIAIVMTTYSSTPPEEVESMVTVPLESALASVEGMDSIMSYSFEGTSIIMLQFDMDIDMDFATLDMREKIALISDYLPDETSEPMVLKMDMSSLPITQIYVTSEDMTLAELNNTVADNITSRFERTSGVASVSVSGGIEEEISIQFNQAQLSSSGLNLSTISQLLAAENINLPIGNVSKGNTEVIVRSLGEFESADDIRNLPLTIADRSIVRLGDIATITKGYADQKEISRINGQTAIGVYVSKQSDANTVKTADNVLKVVDELRAEFPNLNFEIGYNQADFINSSLSSVAKEAILGGILAIMVVFLFLLNIRSTLIVAISIPTSLLATFALMSFLDITLNLITMCALTICIGMLVDDSIIVLENIYRRRSLGDDPTASAVNGSKEILLAIVAATLTKVMVFIPIAMSDGIASLMFADFCWTVVIALLASLLVATTVIPMVSSKIMRGTISTEYVRIGDRRYKYRYIQKFAEATEQLKETYEVLIRKSLDSRKNVILGCVGIFAASSLLIFAIGFELLPETDEGTLTVTVEVPFGTKLEDTDKIMSEVEEYILSLPEVKYVAMTTASLSSMSTTSSDPTISVTLKGKGDRKRSTAEVSDDIENALAHMTTAHVTSSPSSSMSMSFSSYDASIMIKGKDLDTLREIGYDLVEGIENLSSVTEAKLDMEDGNPELRVSIDRNAAAYYGITSYHLANQLSSALSGSKATTLNYGGNQIDVNVSLGEDVSASVEQMKQVLVTGNYGTSVPLGQIATFEYGNSPTQIFRQNQVNTLTLNANLSSTSFTRGTQEIMDFMDSYQFPDGYYVEENGSYQEMMESFTSLGKAFIIAIALVFLLLAAQFESALMSFVVMMAVPFAMTGTFLALFLTGTSLSLTSFLGLILLVGIVVNNSILLVEFTRQNEKELGVKEALIQAGKLRLRPILMTSIATIAGMIPLSLGLGEGGEVLAPMGISIIGGLIASTVVTLILIPVIYSIIDDRKMNRILRRERKDAHVKELEARWAVEDGKSE